MRTRGTMDGTPVAHSLPMQIVWGRSVCGAPWAATMPTARTTARSGGDGWPRWALLNWPLLAALASGFCLLACLNLRLLSAVIFLVVHA